MRFATHSLLIFFPGTMCVLLPILWLTALKIAVRDSSVSNITIAHHYIIVS